MLLAESAKWLNMWSYHISYQIGYRKSPTMSGTSRFDQTPYVFLLPNHRGMEAHLWTAAWWEHRHKINQITLELKVLWTKGTLKLVLSTLMLRQKSKRAKTETTECSIAHRPGNYKEHRRSYEELTAGVFFPSNCGSFCFGFAKSQCYEERGIVA